VLRSETEKTDAPLLQIDGMVEIDRLYLGNIRQSVPEGTETPVLEVKGRVCERVERDVMR